MAVFLSLAWGSRKPLLRLRSILFVVMLTVLMLPLGSIYFFRIYENSLVRQTEQELIAQAAVLAATFRQNVRSLAHPQTPYGRLLTTAPVALSMYKPVPPMLSLINPILTKRPDAQFCLLKPDTTSVKVAKLMTPVLRDTQQVMLTGMRVLDAQGLVIAGREEVGLSLAHVEEVQEALRGFYSARIRQRLSDEPPPPLYSLSRGSNIRAFIAYPIIETLPAVEDAGLEQHYLQGVIYLSRTPNNILRDLYEVKANVVFVSCSVLAIVFALGTLVSATISRPIRELIAQTERIKHGEQKQIKPLKNPVTYEIDQLSSSFAEMSKALVERGDYIRRFATHVSHEFKTPLTAIQGALELIQEHADSMPESDKQRFMANALADTQRLKQLVHRLLELARADALEPSRQTCLLSELLAMLTPRLKARGLELKAYELPRTPLAIAPDALEMVLVNLFENSLQNGANSIEIRANGKSTQLSIALQDNGSGISDANRDKIFTPFFTTKRNQGSAGLGLSICLSVLKAYGGQLDVLACQQGALFKLLIPIVADPTSKSG